MLITFNLSWSEHINSVCIKARKVIGVLYRHFYTNTDRTTLLKLYTALVRPHLEYACQVWNPHVMRDKEKLEKVQKFALRMCYKQWNANYTDLLSYSNILTLENRRLYLSLCIMYCVIHKLVQFYCNTFELKQSCAMRSSQGHQFFKPFAKTNAFYILLYHQCIQLRHVIISFIATVKHSLLSYMFTA